MISLPESLHRGGWRIGTHAEKTPCSIGRLWLWPLVDGSPASRQWLFEVEFPGAEQAGLPKAAWAEVLSRLGLHPIFFGRQLREALIASDPLALVVDTSALHRGAALQACRLRRGKPTIVAVPDQAYMEIHKQREMQSLGKKSSKAAQRLLSTFMPLRNVTRLRSAGHVLHFARPPEPMVRYLGSVIDTAEGEETAVDGAPGASPDAGHGPSHVRDRLILEAARELRRAEPAIKLFVLTADEKFALQAAVEQFGAGLCVVPPLASPARYGSPWLNPHSLELQHLPLSELVEDLVWTLGNVWIQQEGTTTGYSWTLPDHQTRATRLLLEGGTLPYHRVTDLPLGPTAMTESHRVPLKAPTPQSLVSALLKLADGGNRAAAELGEALSYLVAMGWAERTGGSAHATAEGLDQANRWKTMRPDDIDAWCDWIERASVAIERIPVLRSLLETLATHTEAWTDEQLAAGLNYSKRDIGAQLSLASALGAAVRLSGKSWRRGDGRSDMRTAVLDAQRAVAQRSNSSAAPTERVFTSLLPAIPMPLHVFRRAVWHLVRDGALMPGGVMHEAPAERVRLRTILPGVAGGVDPVEVDLGVGDFLIPGETTQDLVSSDRTS